MPKRQLTGQHLTQLDRIQRLVDHTAQSDRRNIGIPSFKGVRLARATRLRRPLL
jgi:hypothetical protein